MNKINIAIDGPAGAGKSTVAKEVAARLGLTYIDTGAMYRALTWKALQQNVDVADEAGLNLLAADTHVSLQRSLEGKLEVFCDNQNVTDAIRSPLVSDTVAKVARCPGVRNRMVELQRQMAAREGVVMDGRDIGTFVLPDAPFKFFLTASLEERARRRSLELKNAGYEVNYEEVMRQMAERDLQDESREVAPLVAAPDARILNTDGIDAAGVVEMIVEACCGK